MHKTSILSLVLLLASLVPISQLFAEAKATLYIPQSIYPHNRVYIWQNGPGGPINNHDIIEEYPANDTGFYTLQHSGEYYARVHKKLLIGAWGNKPAACGTMHGCNGYGFRIASPAQYTASYGNNDGVDITGIDDN